MLNCGHFLSKLINMSHFLIKCFRHYCCIDPIIKPNNMSTFYQKGLSQDDELISQCLDLNRNDQKTNLSADAFQAC